MKFALLNEDLSLLAFYDDKLHKDVPAEAIQISDEVFHQYFELAAYKKILVDGKWIEGATQSEIETLFVSSDPSEIELLKQQNLELRETLDFILTDLIPSLYE